MSPYLFNIYAEDILYSVYIVSDVEGGVKIDEHNEEQPTFCRRHNSGVEQQCRTGRHAIKRTMKASTQRGQEEDKGGGGGG